MKAIRGLLVFTVLGALGTGVLVGQDSKSPPAKVRGQLPQNWKDLGLSDKQKQDIYDLQNKAQGKIDALKDEISKIEAKLKTDREALLTESQKQRLREIMAGKAPAETPKEKGSK